MRIVSRADGSASNVAHPNPVWKPVCLATKRCYYRHGVRLKVRRISLAVAVLLGIAIPGSRADAQDLSFTLFERYLESFRVEAGIPGMSAVIARHGFVVWERGFGRRDVEAALSATPDTPYAIGGLSEIFGSTLLLKKCVDEGSARLTDPVARWLPLYPEPATTLGQLLSHTVPGGGAFKYAPERFASLTGVIDACSETPYRVLLAREVFDRLGMVDSVPGPFAAVPTPEELEQFGPIRLAQYSAALGRAAIPYRVVGGRPQRNLGVPVVPLNAADGIVSSVRDVARLDAAFAGDVLLARATRNLSWTQATTESRPMVTGLGWWVQEYRGEPVVWQFGLTPGGHSSLVVKAPNRGLTFILLANSDGLNAPYMLERGDVTASLFARLFLRFFAP